MNGTNIGTWNLLIHYNTSALTWVNTTSSGLPSGLFGSNGAYRGLPPFSPVEKLFKASFAYMGGSPGATYTNQTIFTISFTYNSGNPDLYFKYISTGSSGNNVTYVMTYTAGVDNVNTGTQFYNPFIVGSISASQSICYNTAPAQLTGVAPTGGATPYSYQWQNSTDNITFNDIPGATSLNYAPGTLTTTTYYRQKQYSSDIQGPRYHQCGYHYCLSAHHGFEQRPTLYWFHPELDRRTFRYDYLCMDRTQWIYIRCSESFNSRRDSCPGRLVHPDRDCPGLFRNSYHNGNGNPEQYDHIDLGCGYQCTDRMYQHPDHEYHVCHHGRNRSYFQQFANRRNRRMGIQCSNDKRNTHGIRNV